MNKDYHNTTVLYGELRDRDRTDGAEITAYRVDDSNVMSIGVQTKPLKNGLSVYQTSYSVNINLQKLLIIASETELMMQLYTECGRKKHPFGFVLDFSETAQNFNIKSNTIFIVSTIHLVQRLLYLYNTFGALPTDLGPNGIRAAGRSAFAGWMKEVHVRRSRALGELYKMKFYQQNLSLRYMCETMCYKIQVCVFIVYL